MKRICILPALLVLLAASLGAQRISHEETFRVNYPINASGYPSPVVPNEDGAFTFVEYWPGGEGRKFPNHYIQTYNSKYEEVWFHPLTLQNAPRLEGIMDVIRMKEAIAMIGYQYSPSTKRMATKMKLYAMDGQSLTGLEMLSNYTKKAKKGYIELLAQSPDRSKLLWLGHNPGAKHKKRSFYCSVVDDNGRRIWNRKLYLPPVEDRYLVRQATVDERGNAYFYMVYEKATNTAEDTLFPPVIVRYDYRENKTVEHRLAYPGASVPEGTIHVTKEGDLAFLGVVSDGGEGGFLNGAKRFETPLRWNRLVFRLFNIERELTEKQSYEMEFPEKMLSRYGERGANFSRGEVLEHQGNLYWVMEEFYTQEHREQLQFLFYDIATVAIAKESGEIRWANTFEKKQRDYKSGRLLSYVPGIAAGKLHFVYLNERGAQGHLMCTSLALSDGETESVKLAGNHNTTYLFFPERSAMIAPNKMLLMGVGNPVGNDYKLIEITF